MTDTLDELTDEAAFEEVLRRCQAEGKRWLFMAGGIRCEDGRCPLEVAAGIERGHVRNAILALWPKTWIDKNAALIELLLRAADGIGYQANGWRARFIAGLIAPREA